jgi:hypothetical protein
MQITDGFGSLDKLPGRFLRAYMWAYCLDFTAPSTYSAIKVLEPEERFQIYCY